MKKVGRTPARDKYDKVQGWLKQHRGATMEEAFKATGVKQGCYYSQKKAIERRGRALEPVIVHEAEPIGLVDAGSPRPGMVALAGAPEDLARFLAALGGAR